MPRWELGAVTDPAGPAGTQGWQGGAQGSPEQPQTVPVLVPVPILLCSTNHAGICLYLMQKWSFQGKENLCQSPLRTFSMRFLWSCKPVRPVPVISAPQGPDSCQREFLSTLDATEMLLSLGNNPQVIPNPPCVSSTALHGQGTVTVTAHMRG